MTTQGALPSRLWRSYSPSHCCLCGTSEARLTGEHKIKASALRKEFGNDSLVVGVIGAAERMKPAQSTNSKRLKFSAGLCESCNSSRTQKGDREFDHFHSLVLARLANHEDPNSVFDMPRYHESRPEHLDLFRYFSKLLCCHIASVAGPIPVALARFAVGETFVNRIWLEVKPDPVYDAALREIGEYGYAAHGGLVVYADKVSHTPNAFHSTLTVGAAQYVFHTRLTDAEKAELLAEHGPFIQWCRSRVDEAVANPIPVQTLQNLGLASDETSGGAASDAA